MFVGSPTEVVGPLPIMKNRRSRSEGEERLWTACYIAVPRELNACAAQKMSRIWQPVQGSIKGFHWEGSYHEQQYYCESATGPFKGFHDHQMTSMRRQLKT